MSLHALVKWKLPAILLTAIGLSNIGAWIYFIALNLIVLELSQSPLTLSMLYIIGPIAGLFTNLWSGSLVDRINKKALMIGLDFFRGAMLLLLYFHANLVMIYIVTFVVQMASHLFGNTSFAYKTKLVEEPLRPRFNALHGMLSSGAFIIGPAVAGLLFMISSPMVSIAINSIILFISGVITWLLPNMDSENKKDEQYKSPLHLIKQDMSRIVVFYKNNHYILTLCILFGGLTVVLATAVDSLEASFATLVLLLPEEKYGFLVSIAGIGMGIGSIINVTIVNKVSVSTLLRLGVLGNAIGYCIYAFSTTFLMASIGFFVLAFFLSFANSAFITLYQKHVPTDILGRIGAFNGLIESLFIIILTSLFGFIAHMHEIRPLVIVGASLMLLLSVSIYFVEKNKTLRSD